MLWHKKIIKHEKKMCVFLLTSEFADCSQRVSWSKFFLSTKRRNWRDFHFPGTKRWSWPFNLLVSQRRTNYLSLSILCELCEFSFRMFQDKKCLCHLLLRRYPRIERDYMIITTGFLWLWKSWKNYEFWNCVFQAWKCFVNDEISQKLPDTRADKCRLNNACLSMEK